jgi:hypothetical protein
MILALWNDDLAPFIFVKKIIESSDIQIELPVFFLDIK